MQTQTPPSPALLLETLNAYQKTAAIRAAIELDLFTAIAEGVNSPAALAARCGAAQRGIRILSDHMVVLGFLNKSGDAYSLTPDSAVFLDQRSPAYMGGVAGFFLTSRILEGFNRLTDAVRKGGTALDRQGTLEAEHEVWVEFARAMGPMMRMPSEGLAAMILNGSAQPMEVLDISAGHGLYGLAFAKQNPQARVTGLDWANVLQVARENAMKMGVGDRYALIAGSAFDVDPGGPYDVILLPNFLHHFDPPTCQKLLERLRHALKTGGRIATLDFIPNEDRVTPKAPAAFGIVMLSSTPSGDAYTFGDYQVMFENAGFSKNTLHRMGESPHAVIVSQV